MTCTDFSVLEVGGSGETFGTSRDPRSISSMRCGAKGKTTEHAWV